MQTSVHMPKTAGADFLKALHKRIIEADWSFERFCFGPEMKNFHFCFFWVFL